MEGVDLVDVEQRLGAQADKWRGQDENLKASLPEKQKPRHSTNAYRAALIARGFTVSEWARQQGYHPSTVFEAIRGNRHGALSKEILRKLERLVK